MKNDSLASKSLQNSCESGVSASIIGLEMTFTCVSAQANHCCKTQVYTRVIGDLTCVVRDLRCAGRIRMSSICSDDASMQVVSYLQKTE